MTEVGFASIEFQARFPVEVGTAYVVEEEEEDVVDEDEEEVVDEDVVDEDEVVVFIMGVMGSGVAVVDLP